MEEKEELVDILLTTYNSNQKFLRKQLNSILDQTHKNIKLIISDDKSTNSRVLKTLEEYEKKDNRVIVYAQPKNLGYNKNFEFLLKQSKADYIMFCDHDDIWHKDKVEKSLNKLKEEGVSLIYANSTQIDENDKLLKKDYFKYKCMPLIKGKNNHLAISRYAGLGCSQIFTKEVKEKIIPFKKSVMAHDWLAGFVASELNGIDYIDDPLFDYRLHTNNVFGGRSLSQNLNRWKESKGKSYESFLEYRNNVIDSAYLNGTKMCLDYCENEKDKEFIEKIIKYYENLKKSKYINFHLIKYFRFLGGKNLFKKMIKEIAIFHLPILSCIMFKKI